MQNDFEERLGHAKIKKKSLIFASSFSLCSSPCFKKIVMQYPHTPYYHINQPNNLLTTHKHFHIIKNKNVTT
jgi:hypothetical protein